MATQAPIRIDGSYGEGGGQIVRSALALAVLLRRPVAIDRVRARRPKPGLAAQHLTAVRAAASLCDAQVSGAALGSTRLRFTPRTPARPGDHVFDVSTARRGGSAGSATLVLQAVFVPLALAGAPSRVAIRGGTHVPFSPPFEYLRDVWLPTLARIGLRGRLELVRTGWYPRGGGELVADVAPAAPPLRALELVERGPLERIRGFVRVARLPDHIPRRMCRRVENLLAGVGAPVELETQRVDAAGPGVSLFLCAEYAQVRAGFSAHGERGKRAEQVAEEAVSALRAHRASGAALDAHLADQLLLPLALAPGVSRVTLERVTEHVRTLAWLLGQFGTAEVDALDSAQPAELHVRPRLDPRGSSTHPGAS